MQGDKIEIRYNSPRIGYATEIFENCSPQAAINALRARVGNDVQISWTKYHTAPETRTDGSTRR